jgi:hypothetical protein
MAYIQIKEVKSSTESTKREVTEAMSKMREMLIVSELAKTVQILRVIQDYLKSKKYEFAQLRMKDVKGALLQIKDDSKLSTLINPDKYNSLIMEYGMHLSNIHNYITGRKKTGFKAEAIDEYMENLASLLIEIENKILNSHER